MSKKAKEKKKHPILCALGIVVVLSLLASMCGNPADDSKSSTEAGTEAIPEVTTEATDIPSAESTLAEESDSAISETTVETVPIAPAQFVLDSSTYTDANIGPIDTTGLELVSGDLLSINYGGDGVFVVKAKISPSYSNKATIDQNYFSVCDLIKKHGFNTCTELQYWAVADMTDGSESKVISFTVDSITIQGVYNGNVIDNELGDYVTDLWILPSLTK